MLKTTIKIEALRFGLRWGRGGVGGGVRILRKERGSWKRCASAN